MFGCKSAAHSNGARDQPARRRSALGHTCSLICQNLSIVPMAHKGGSPYRACGRVHFNTRCWQPGKSCKLTQGRQCTVHVLQGGVLIHIRAQKYASHHVDADFRELHISAGITHHPNLNPEGDAGFCWSLPETSKLNETSRTPVFSARTAAILMRH